MTPFWEIKLLRLLYGYAELFFRKFLGKKNIAFVINDVNQKHAAAQVAKFINSCNICSLNEVPTKHLNNFACLVKHPDNNVSIAFTGNIQSQNSVKRIRAHCYFSYHKGFINCVAGDLGSAVSKDPVEKISIWRNFAGVHNRSLLV